MKRYVLIAGVNGAGKTTLYQTLQSLQDMPRINTDEILREFGDWRNTTDVMTAGRIAVKRIRQYFEEGKSFHQETTLCGRSILKNVERAKSRGYVIEMHYIGVDNVDIAKERVAERVRQGGHGIPEKDIERRYTASFQNVEQVLPACSLAVFYDNTVEFQRVAVYQNGRFVRISDKAPEWFVNTVFLTCARI